VGGGRGKGKKPPPKEQVLQGNCDPSRTRREGLIGHDIREDETLYNKMSNGANGGEKGEAYDSHDNHWGKHRA